MQGPGLFKSPFWTCTLQCLPAFSSQLTPDGSCWGPGILQAPLTQTPQIWDKNEHLLLAIVFPKASLFECFSKEWNEIRVCCNERVTAPFLKFSGPDTIENSDLHPKGSSPHSSYIGHYSVQRSSAYLGVSLPQKGQSVSTLVHTDSVFPYFHLDQQMNLQLPMYKGLWFTLMLIKIVSIRTHHHEFTS